MIQRQRVAAGNQTGTPDELLILAFDHRLTHLYLGGPPPAGVILDHPQFVPSEPIVDGHAGTGLTPHSAAVPTQNSIVLSFLGSSGVCGFAVGVPRRFIACVYFSDVRGTAMYATTLHVL